MTDSNLVVKVWMREPKDQVEFWVGGSGFGFRFPGFFAKKTGFNRTGPVRFELVFGPVWFIFHKINVVRLVF